MAMVRPSALPGNRALGETGEGGAALVLEGRRQDPRQPVSASLESVDMLASSAAQADDMIMFDSRGLTGCDSGSADKTIGSR